MPIKNGKHNLEPRKIQQIYQTQNVTQLYPIKKGSDAKKITEEEYTVGVNEIQFTGFDSCMGVVRRNGKNLIGVHLVLSDSNGKPVNEAVAQDVADVLKDYNEITLIE